MKKHNCEECEHLGWDNFCLLTNRYVGGWCGLDKRPAFCPIKHKEEKQKK